MTEKEYEALYEALEAAHKILPGAKECDAKDSELRKKIRKLEKAVRKRQEKVARAEGRKNKYQVRRKHGAEPARRTCETAGSAGSKSTVRIASFRIAESMGFKGEFRQWEDLLRIGD